MEQLLKALSQPVNQAIIGHLRTEPAYARQLSAVLGIPESEASRRLRHLESVGLLSGDWAYVGKNVKLYRLDVDRVSIDFADRGIQVQLDNAEGVKSASVQAAPIHIPAVDEVIGRDNELRALSESDGPTVVEGIAGIGKTTVLAAHCQGLRDAAIFWHAFRGVESSYWLISRIATFLAPLDGAGMLDAVRAGQSAADHREALLAHADGVDRVFVFDDMHDAPADVVRLLADLVSRTSQARILFGSRATVPDLAAAGVTSLPLAGVDDEGVRAMLVHAGMDADADTLRALRRKLGGHPLGIRLSVAAAAQPGQDLRALVGALPERNLQDFLMQEIYDNLDPTGQQLLVSASLFRIPFTADDLAAARGTAFRADLVKLRRQLLLQEVGDGFTMHEVMRSFFYSLIDHPATLHEKLAKHYRSKPGIEARLEALHHFEAAGREDDVRRLLEDNLDVRDFDLIDAGYHELYLETLQRIDATRLSDRHRALLEDDMGDIRFHQGRYEEAIKHYEAAVTLFAAHDGDAGHDEDLTWKMAQAAVLSGDKKRARGLCEAALAAAPKGSQTHAALQSLLAGLD